MNAPLLESGPFLVQEVDLSPSQQQEGGLRRWRLVHQAAAVLTYVLEIRAPAGRRLLCECRQGDCVHVRALRDLLAVAA